MKKINIIKLLLIFSLITNFNIVFPDNEQGTGEIDSESLLPKTIQPIEPTMASLGKYSVYNVNLFNGLPNISFKLLDIKSGGLTLPITIQYHGGGVKPSEEASWVGLGWDLNYGGAITRTVHGLPDEREDLSNIPTVLDIRNKMDEDLYNFNVTEFESYTNGTVTHMQDFYHYNLFGASGMYVIDNNGDAMSVPLNSAQIDNSTKSVTLSDGTVINTVSIDATTVKNPSKTDITYTSSWGIKDITAANGIDKITFEYQDDGWMTKFNYTTFEEEVTTEKYADDCQIYQITSQPIIKNSPTNMKLNAKKVEYIRFDGGYVKFELGDRYDIPSNITTVGRLKKLEKIIIYYYDKNNLPVKFKEYNFHYSYFGGVPTGAYSYSNSFSYKLKLDKITESGINGDTKLFLSFNYNNTALPPKTNSNDFWGYKNETVIEASEEDMKAGVLEEIHYPTGGKTVFDWQANECYFFKNSTIQYVKIDASFSEYTSHTHEHLSTGEIPDDPSQEPYTIESFPFNVDFDQTCIIKCYLKKSANTFEHNKYDAGYIRIDNNTTGDSWTYSEAYNSIVVHEKNYSFKQGHSYTIYLKSNCDNLTANIQFDYQKYKTTGDAGYSKNFKVGGLRINKISNFNDENNFISAKKYSYMKPSDNSMSSGYFKGDLSYFDYEKNVNSYRKEGCFGYNGSFTIPCMTLKTRMVMRYKNAVSGIYGTPVCYQFVQEYNIDENNNNIGYTNYEYSVCKDFLSDPIAPIISEEWKRGDLLFKKVYKKANDDSYELIEEVENIFSFHENSEKSVFGFAMRTNISNTSMFCEQDSDMHTIYDFYDPLNYVVETSWKHLDKTISKKKFNNSFVTTETNYSYNNANHKSPQSVTFTGSNDVVTINYEYYNNYLNLVKSKQKSVGNEEVFKEELTYNSNFDVEKYIKKVNNEIINQVDYKYNESRLIEAKKSNDIPHSIIWNSDKTNPLAIIEGAHESELSVLFKNEVAKLESPTLSEIQSINSAIRNLLPESSVVKTFTYKPLVGMTSQTDPNGKTIYYEYDDFGRLKTIKDNEEKVIKEVKYKYATEQ